MINQVILTVKCPKDDDLKSVPLDLVKAEDGKIIPLPCQGCEHCNGSNICEKCRTSLTIMFFNGYDLQIGQAVILDFSVLK